MHHERICNNFRKHEIDQIDLSLLCCVAPDHFLCVITHFSDTYTAVAGNYMSTQLSD